MAPLPQITTALFTEGTATWTVGTAAGDVYIFREARRVYLPGPEKPEVVVVVEPAALHVFDYHHIDYMTKSP